MAFNILLAIFCVRYTCIIKKVSDVEPFQIFRIDIGTVSVSDFFQEQNGFPFISKGSVMERHRTVNIGLER